MSDWLRFSGTKKLEMKFCLAGLAWIFRYQKLFLDPGVSWLIKEGKMRCPAYIETKLFLETANGNSKRAIFMSRLYIFQAIDHTFYELTFLNSEPIINFKPKMCFHLA
jgi:hypothetical protein